MSDGHGVAAPIAADAVLFDNDSTLVDTTTAVDRAWHDFAVHNGVEPASAWSLVS